MIPEPELDHATPGEVARDIRRTIRVLVYATVLLYLVVFAALAYAILSARDTRQALCSLRADVEQRVADGELFLAEHPNGTEGFSRATIEASLANSRRTAAALSGLDCPTVEQPPPAPAPPSETSP